MTPTSSASSQRDLVFAGITTVDLVQVAANLPAVGEKASTQTSYLDVGGPAANAAVTASILGAKVSLATVIGTGQLAGFARDSLESYDVAVTEQPSDMSLPVSSIWVDAGSGERTILAADNAKARVGPISGLLVPDRAAAVLLDGHYAELAVTVARRARSAGVPVVLDCGRWRPAYGDLLPLATDVIACATFRPPDLTGAAPEEALPAMRDRWGLELCAMTRGPDSILVAANDGVEEVPVSTIDAADTLGAGDVLHGAYVYYRYDAGLDGAEALARGAALASESCLHLGARQAVVDAAGRVGPG